MTVHNVDIERSGDELAPIAQIHASIVQRLCKVQASVEAIAKTGFNKHGGYKHSTTDDVYAALTRKLGEVGLVIMPIELSPVAELQATVGVFDKDGKRTGEKQITKLRFHFGYVLATEEATWFDPRSARSIIILHTGPQTFAAAESFLQKYYLRALFKLPTGEMDLDGFAQADTDDDQAAQNGAGKTPRKASAEGKRDGSVKRYNELNAALVNADGAVACAEIWKKNGELLRTLPRAWFETLSQDFVAKMSSKFGVELDIDAEGWPILEAREEAA